MKKTLRSYLISILICVFAVVLALGVMTACGGDKDKDGDGTGTQQGGSGNEGGSGDEGGEGGDITDTTHKVTLSLAGGTLATTEFTLKEGEDLYTELSKYAPTRTGYEFGKWTLNGADVVEGTKMPAADATVTAVWKSPVAVTVYTLDFEHYDVYVEGTPTTVYAYAGATLDAEDYVPAHYELNEDKTEELSVTVPETTDATLSVYVTPLYTRYSDVFDSSDYLYELEAEAGVLYLDRVEMAEGRKKSTSYDPATGAFSFKTGEEQDSFVLEGVISGEKFYYYRDTINQTFADYLDTDASLKIESKDKVTYTPAGGQAQTGKYTVDAARGVYVFAPATGDPVEFVLSESAGILYFRLHDGVEGWYAYDGEFEEGGWSLLGFDGFGVATSVEDDGVEIEYEYVCLGNGVIDVYDLGMIKLNDEPHEDLGGYKVSGTFSQSDGYEGEYTYQAPYSHRIDVLTLDGFGGAVHTYHTDDNPTVFPISDGTYTVERDETWTIRGGGQVGDYGGVNEYINYTAINKEEDATDPVFSKGNGSGKVVLSESTDDEGNTANNFAVYYVSDDGSISLGAGSLSVLPGIYPVKGDHFVYLGTTYPLNETHKAFLYFYNHNYSTSSFQEVDLWYGTYNETLEEDVYELIVYAGWYDGDNEIYDPNDETYYNGMYFKDMAEDSSFEFDYEDYEGETEDYVFYDGAEGKLIMDGFGDVYWVPATGDRALVDYDIVAQGLIFVFEFNFTGADVPETVSTLWAFYDGYYDYRAEETTEVFYDLNASTSHVYEYSTDAEPADGELATIIVTSDLTFVGFWFEYTDETIGVEYLYAGDSAAVQDTQNEFTFAWNEDIYYDDLDLLELFYDVADFHNFNYKVTDDTFIYGDGVKLNLTKGENDTLVTDGYGTATLTEGGKATTGEYDVEYDVLTFLPDGIEDLPDEEYYDSIRYFHIDAEKNTFVEIDSETPEGLFEGYYIGAILDENGDVYDYTDDGLFLNGVGSFIYETYVYSDDDYDFVLETKTGTYDVIDVDQPMAGLTYIIATVAFTFEDKTTAEGIIFFYDYYEDGGMYPFFVLKNDALLGDYVAVTDDGEQLGLLVGGDGYYEYGATFEGEDADGPFSYEGYLARGYLEDSYYNATPEFTPDKDGDVVVFDTVDEDGKQLQFVFDIDEDAEVENTVVYRDKFYGTVTEYKVQGEKSGKYLHLDGHSVAVLYNKDGEVEMEGTYEFVETMEDVYAFKDDKGEVQFLFSVSMETDSVGVTYYYTQYVKKEDVLFVNDDWSIFYMDGFGSVAYVDKYGVAYGGEGYKATDDYDVYCLKVEGSTKRIYFELDFEHKSFTVMGSEEFLVKDGVLLLYFGTDESITIPDEVTRIAEGAFILSGAVNVKEIDFNNVKTIDAGAFYHATSLEVLSSDKIETIGANAFEGIWELTKVDLPNCTSIGAEAFLDCVQLTEVKLGKIESIGAYAFTRSIALYETPFVLDLTAVADFTKLTIDFTAFLAKRGAFGVVNETIFVEGSKVLVGGGVEGLNAAAAKLKGKTGSISYHDMSGAASDPNKEGEVDVDLTPYLALPAAEEDPADGLAFYNLATDTVLVFEEGLVTVYAKGSYNYDDEQNAYAYYVENGKAVVYYYDDAQKQYVKLVEVDPAAKNVTLNSVNYLASGESGTTTTTVGGKTVEITYTIELSSFLGISVEYDVTAVKYDGQAIEEFTFDDYEGTLEFTVNNHFFKGAFKGGKLTIEDMGAEHILESKTLDIWFRLTVLVTDDGKVSLKTLEYADDGKGEYYYEAYSDDVIQLGDTVWGYGSNNKLYELTVSKDASGTLSLTASNEGYYVVDSDRSYKVSLTVSEDLTQIETVHVIVDTAYTPTVYHVQSQTLSEDKTTATVTTDNGKFVIKISASESGVKFQLEVTHTDYDYTDELYDSDYDYAVTVKYHVDEEGNAKATGIEKIVMNNEDETVLEIDSVTVGADGVFTVNLKDKRVAKITVVSGSWSDSVTIEWVEA